MIQYEVNKYVLHAYNILLININALPVNFQRPLKGMYMLSIFLPKLLSYIIITINKPKTFRHDMMCYQVFHHFSISMAMLIMNKRIGHTLEFQNTSCNVAHFISCKYMNRFSFNKDNTSRQKRGNDMNIYHKL